ncbi:MAG: hypothetical protein VX223_04805, partial [Myxococcota bacterium]|nr:hypothetical protein [Myxococcota bacterium]
MKRTFLWLPFCVTMILQGCPDDDPAPVPTDDVVEDTDDGDTSDRDADEDALGDDDASTEDIADGLTISCLIGIESGLQPLADFTLGDEDEPESYRQSPGFQVDFRASSDNVPTGSAVELSVSGTVLQSLGVDSAGEVSFDNVTLPPGAAQVELAITRGEETATCTATVTVQTGLCDVELLPVADTCLTGEGESSTTQTFTVNNPNELCDRAIVVYRVNGNEQSSDPVSLVDGTAEITVELFSGLVNAETVEVKAQVSSSEFGSLTAETEFVSYEVDSAPPTPTITSLSTGAQLGLAADVDADLSNGVQVQLQGTVGTADVSSISVTTVSGQVITPIVNGDTWVAELNFPADVSGDTVQVIVSDACGNEGQAEVTDVGVSTLESVLEIVSPTSGTLLAASDSDPLTDTIYETDFLVQATSLSVPTTLDVRCSPDFDQIAPTLVGTLDISAVASDDIYTIANVAIDTTGGLNTWQCRIIDAGINPTQSPIVDLIIGLPAPSVEITSPSSDVTNSITVALGGVAANLDGQKGSIAIVDSTSQVVFEGVVTSEAVVSGGFSFTTFLTDDGTSTAAALPDGQYTLQLSIVDQFGNDACAVESSVCSRSLRLDTVAPVVSLQAPAAGALDPLTTPDTGASPGYQTSVTVGVNDAGFEAGTEVCLTIGGVEACLVVQDTETTVNFTDITLQPGENTLQLTATDTAGNAAATVTEVINLMSDAPIVSFVSPASSTSTSSPQITLVVSVTTIDNVSLSNANVIARIGGVATNDVPVYDSVAGTYTFSDLALPGFGVFDILVEASVAGGSVGATSTLQVNVKDGPPTLSFTGLGSSPSTLNLSSSQCQPGQSDCVLTITCDSTNLDDGSTASLSWQCGGAGLQQASTTVS